MKSNKSLNRAPPPPAGFRNGSGGAREGVVKLIQEAIEFHIEGLRSEDLPVPEASSSVEFVDVAA